MKEVSGMSWREVSYILSTSENYVWRELDYFSSPANVCRFLKKRYPNLDTKISEIDEIYIRIFGSYPSIFSGGLTYHWKGDKAEKIDLFIDRKTKQVTEELLIERLPMLKTGYDKEENNKYFKFTCSPDVQSPPSLCEDIYGNIYIKGGVPTYLCKSRKIELSGDRLLLLDLEVHFLIMYTLSMLCRYELRVWDNLMVKKKQGLDYLIKRFLEISSCKFPLLIWREIFNTHFVLMPPGTLYKPYR